MKNFYQDGPRLQNTFQSDLNLQKFLKNKLPQESQKEIFAHLQHVGDLERV